MEHSPEQQPGPAERTTEQSWDSAWDAIQDHIREEAARLGQSAEEYLEELRKKAREFDELAASPEFQAQMERRRAELLERVTGDHNRQAPPAELS